MERGKLGRHPFKAKQVKEQRKREELDDDVSFLFFSFSCTA